MRATVAALTFPLLVAGCVFPFFVGDGAFRVVGEVTSESAAPPTCSLRLLSASNREVPLQTITVTGAFKETFMVPPTRGIFEVELTCGGKVVRLVTVKYGTEVTYATPVDLGHLVL